MGSVARDFRINNVTLSPLLLLTYRFSDLVEARRWRPAPATKGKKKSSTSSAGNR